MAQKTKKTSNKRFVRYSEGAEMYSMSVLKFMQLAKDAKSLIVLRQKEETLVRDQMFYFSIMIWLRIKDYRLIHLRALAPY